MRIHGQEMAAVGVVYLLCQAAGAGVLAPPRIVAADAADYPQVESRRFQGISSMAVSPGGRLWATWYAGPTAGEDANNYVVVATSGDGGGSWSEVLVVDPDGPGPLRAYDPEIWVDPQDRLWLFWAQAISYGVRAQTWAMIAAAPDSADAAWGGPFHVAPGVMMCKPTVLRSGSWLLPVSCWEARVSDSPDAASAMVYVSCGEGSGSCFRLLGAALVPLADRRFDEHMVVERRDGSLWMLVRTHYGMGESVSTDGGRTWSVVAPSNIQHPSARFFIRRLNSGNLLLVKHGPIDKPAGRSHLTAFVSKDDGATWGGGFLLDERTGVSYPDGQQTGDGVIHITYDFSRTTERAVFMAAFTEDDVLAGKAVSGNVRLRVPISTPGNRLPAAVAPYVPGTFDLDESVGGVKLETSGRGRLSGEFGAGGSAAALEAGAQVFSDRDVVFSVIPDQLKGRRFIRSAMASSRQQVQRKGTVCVIGHRDIEAELLAKVFEKTDVPQFIPFVAHDRRDGYDPNDACSVFQKFFEEGEFIEYGSWGITVF